jgi:hypothetical protein
MGRLIKDETMNFLRVETRVYRDMVFIYYTHNKSVHFTQKHKEWIDIELEDWMKLGWPEDVTKMHFQVSQNHEHMYSKNDALRLIKRVHDDFDQRYPKLAYRLAVDWRQGGKREKGNVVMVSFWLDVLFKADWSKVHPKAEKLIVK